MYWNNPTINLTYPSTQDPIVESFHSGCHCLFYNPAQDKNTIRTNQRLQDLCDWANIHIASQGIDGFVEDPANHYDIANLVKLNIWVDDLPKQGSIKPMLLQYVGRPLLESGTGESRLRALERVKSINTVSAFISTHVQYQDQFAHLESITTFDQFAKLCSAEPGQQFLFRLTDAQAPYGIDWYEYNSLLTSAITPGEDYCVAVMSCYLQQHPGTTFTPVWFDTLVNWDQYKNF
jgi:hypothetical protein